MIHIECDAKIVRAAQHCQAKNDIRYYLKGIFFSATGDVVSTNGHVMFLSSIDTSEDVPPANDVIMHIDGNIPVSASRISIRSYDDGTTIAVATDKKGREKIFGAEIIDGNFPDYKKVIPYGDPEAVKRANLQTKYLAIPSKMFDSCHVEFRGDSEAYCVTPRKECGWPKSTKVLIMPLVD